MVRWLPPQRPVGGGGGDRDRRDRDRDRDRRDRVRWRWEAQRLGEHARSHAMVLTEPAAQGAALVCLFAVCLLFVSSVGWFVCLVICFCVFVLTSSITLSESLVSSVVCGRLYTRAIFFVANCLFTLVFVFVGCMFVCRLLLLLCLLAVALF